ncbi:MAG TPA: hypothetical protein VFR58_00085 [Flavisolibacter sp.]|nr:hypothetical protein [Flavisolibacter sp.]
MGGPNRILPLKYLVSGIIMLLALAWLTVSLPFVNAAQESQELAAQKLHQSGPESDCDNNPFSNTTEEKTESGASTLSEYLHEYHPAEHGFVILASYYKCHPSDLYFAFHPELLSPPPEA